jgi:hypothetical protein
MYAFIQDVPINEEAYQRIRAALGPEPPDGLVVHLALRRDDGTLRYVDVWRDKESCDAAFRERIHAAVYSVLQEMGFKPAGEPSRVELAPIHVWLGNTK